MPPSKRKDGEPVRVVFYIRFSSWKQDYENSKEGQLNYLQAYADAHGYTVVGIYVDEGITGKKDDRQDLNRLMRNARIRERPFDMVLIWKIDRLGRRSSTIDRRATELEKLGITITAIQQPIEGKPAVVKFFRNTLANMAEFISDNMGEDIARGKRTSASHGVWTNSAIPFGLKRDYRLDRGRMRPFLIPDPDTEWIIRRLFELYLDGTRSTTIAQIFQDEEVPNSSEKPWTGQDVTRRLKNIAYAGFIRHGKHSVLDDAELVVPWPEMELVSLVDYNQAQEIMASHNPKSNHPREVASVHLLSGRVFCGICEYKMSPTGGVRSYYNCNHRRRHLSSCDTPNPPADLLDAAVLQHILNKVVTKENTKRVLAIVAKSQTETMMEVEDELRNVSLEIENLKGARRALLLMVEDKENDVGPGDISERVSEIRDELKGLEANALEAKAKMSNEKALISNPEKVAAYVQDLGTYLRGTNLDLTKQILRELLVQVRVLPGETKNTATLIIKYRIPTPPKGWSNEADVEELVLRRNARSLELPVQAAAFLAVPVLHHHPRTELQRSGQPARIVDPPCRQ